MTEGSMANLTECEDCGHMVSKRADSCPSCGSRFKLHWYEGRWSAVFKAVLIIFLIWLVINIAL